MKKLSIVSLVAIIIISVMSPSAIAAEYNMQHQYICDDGSIIEYNFDSDGNPYRYIDNEKTIIALPLEQYRVTDKALLKELNAALTETAKVNGIMRVAPPTSYFPLTILSSGIKSVAYSESIIYHSSVLTKFTSYLKIVEFLPIVRMKTANLKRNFGYISKNITYSFWYFDGVNGTWYGQSSSNVNCTGEVKAKLLSCVTFLRYGYIYTENIKSFVANVWLTNI